MLPNKNGLCEISEDKIAVCENFFEKFVHNVLENVSTLKDISVLRYACEYSKKIFYSSFALAHCTFYIRLLLRTTN